jgi:hypothetical protein
MLHNFSLSAALCVGPESVRKVKETQAAAPPAPLVPLASKDTLLHQTPARCRFNERTSLMTI